MFREKYIRDNAQIAPDETVSERVLEAVLQEEARRIPSIAPHRQKRRMWRRVIAAVACLAMVLGVSWTALRLTAPSGTPVATPAHSVGYDEIYTLIRSIRKVNAMDTLRSGVGDLLNLGSKDVMVEESVADGAVNGASNDFAVYTTITSGSTTQTNTQYANVDEADIVKTDGEYLYVLDSEDKAVTIVRADGANTAVVSTISLSDLADQTDGEERYLNVMDLYYVDDRLVVLYSMDGGYYYNSANRLYYAGGSLITGAAVYDVSDRTAPQRLSCVAQDGSLTDSRVVNGVLYLVTSYWLGSTEKKNEPATYIPSLYCNGESTCVAAGDLSVIADPDECNYTVITATSLLGEVERLSQQAVFGSGSGIVWANTSHLMLAQPHYKTHDEETALEDGRVQHDSYGGHSTALSLFSLDNGSIAHVADTTVEGTLDGQFAIDEYDGYFRLAVTRSSYRTRHITINDGDDLADFSSETVADNALYVLDGTLTEVGRVEDLAKGEQVKSVRFDGTIGYVVTYEQVDPLFAIDLSDPTKPTVLSALKITGFSEYLHPYAKNRLLGFGYAGTESGLITGLKLTMFDTTDKSNVTVHHTCVLPETYHHSDALYDHHAILVDTARSLIGFPAYGETGVTYLLFTYDEESGFTMRAGLHMSGTLEQRGIWIDNVFYLCSADGVYVYEGGSYERLAMVDL